MKICIVNPFDVWEATGRRLINIGTFLHNRGHDVTLIASRRLKKGSPQEIPFELIEVPPLTSIKRVTNMLSSVPKLAALLRTDFDIVHASKTIPYASLPALVASRLKSRKMVVDWDDWEGRAGLGKFMPLLISDIHTVYEQWIPFHSDGTIVDAHFLENLLRSKGYTKPIAYLPNGVNLDGYRNVKKTRLPPNSVVIVGTLSSTSELPYILQAIAIVAKRVDVNLLVIGDGERRKEFEDIVRRMKLEARVRFLGWVSEGEKKSILHSADVALMPMADNIQNKTRSPVKLPEYMALGCAIVSNDVGDMRHILGESGLLAGQKPEEFAESITMLLEKTGLRNKLKRMAADRVKAMDWGYLMKSVEPFYETIVKA